MGLLFFLLWEKSNSETELLWPFCSDTTPYFWVVLYNDAIPHIFHSISLTQLSFQQQKYAFLLLVKHKLIRAVKLQFPLQFCANSEVLRHNLNASTSALNLLYVQPLAYYVAI